MKKILTLAFGLVLLVAAAFALHAQGHEFHHRMGMMHGDMEQHEELMAKALDLTDEQKAAARKIHEEVAAKAKPLMEQSEQQWQEIHDMLESGSPDATAIGQRVIAAHATREQLSALHEEAMAKFSALLNADQLEKLKKFKEMHERGEGFRGHGPGGPGF
ncbi:MAG TPA: periplasmic heavy metal sensor [Thermoanaerobaculia bacterium]